MEPDTPQPVTYLTPTYSGDFERFSLLRESMVSLGITTPHVAVVPGRDVRLFESMPFCDGLVVVAEPQVPRMLEVAPTRWQRAYNPLTRAYRRVHSGWFAQQMFKLDPFLEAKGSYWVCLDSDCVFLDPIDESRLRSPRGLPFVYEERAKGGIGDVDYQRRAAQLLGLTDAELLLDRNYTSVLVPMERTLVVELLTFLERRHNAPWWWVMARHRATEYASYGLFARNRTTRADLVFRDHALAWLAYDFDPATFPDLLARLREAGTPLLMMHSKMGVEPEQFAPYVRRLWGAS